MRIETTDHEEYCKRHFDAWLAKKQVCSNRQWEKGTDPPDFFLTMDGARYAVEVSRIADEGRTTASESLSRLVDNLERDRLENGSLSGTYIVDADEALPRGARYRREFRKQIEEYIDETRKDDHPFRRDVQIGGRRVARIEKYLPTGAVLAYNGIGGGGWEYEIRQEYKTIMDGLIRRKKDRLERHAPAVLVLQDALCPIGPHILRGVIGTIHEVAAFEAIYIIRAEEGEIVWSRPNWRFGV